MNFTSKLEKKWGEKKFVSIGLDPVSKNLPKGVKSFFEFNKKIIDATHDLVAVYKPNSAFYEAEGSWGIEELKKTTDYIHKKYPYVFILFDAKRADIGNTNEGYAKFAFDYLKADAITVHPYLGQEAMTPFLKRNDKGIFVLCRTSNPGASEFQDLEVNGSTLYEKVAFQVARKWSVNDNAGLVVGATYPIELSKVRSIAKNLPILIPGVGAQGGDLKEAVMAVKKNFIISASRSIIFASKGDDFDKVARAEVEKLNRQILESL